MDKKRELHFFFGGNAKAFSRRKEWESCLIFLAVLRIWFFDINNGIHFYILFTFFLDEKSNKKIKNERHILFLCAPKASPLFAIKTKFRSVRPHPPHLPKYELT